MEEADSNHHNHHNKKGTSISYTINMMRARSRTVRNKKSDSIKDHHEDPTDSPQMKYQTIQSFRPEEVKELLSQHFAELSDAAAANAHKPNLTEDGKRRFSLVRTNFKNVRNSLKPQLSPLSPESFSKVRSDGIISPMSSPDMHSHESKHNSEKNSPRSPDTPEIMLPDGSSGQSSPRKHQRAASADNINIRDLTSNSDVLREKIVALKKQQNEYNIQNNQNTPPSPHITLQPKDHNQGAGDALLFNKIIAGLKEQMARDKKIYQDELNRMRSKQHRMKSKMKQLQERMDSMLLIVEAREKAVRDIVAKHADS